MDIGGLLGMLGSSTGSNTKTETGSGSSLGSWLADDHNRLRLKRGIGMATGNHGITRSANDELSQMGHEPLGRRLFNEIRKQRAEGSAPSPNGYLSKALRRDPDQRHGAIGAITNYDPLGRFIKR